jgi:FtsZ-binding cell division protein ZapB
MGTTQVRLSKEREKEIRNYPDNTYCGTLVKDAVKEIDALRAEKNKIQDDYQEYKRHYDSIFASSIVIKTEEYDEQVKERDKLKAENETLRNRLKVMIRESQRNDLEEMKIPVCCKSCQNIAKERDRLKAENEELKKQYSAFKIASTDRSVDVQTPNLLLDE